MKKVFLLGVAALLTLGACSSTSDTTSSSSSSASETSTTASNDSDYQKELARALYNPDAVFPQLSTEVADNEAEVILHTSEGDITIKLFPEETPLAVENFLTHAKEGYYDGITFHRVIDGFMIQAGDPNGDGTGGESIWNGVDDTIDAGNGFANEISAYLYNIRGALAMANAGADTNGSQFFINQNPADASSGLSSSTTPAKIIESYANGGNPSLDGDYTVFGQVIDGMDVVDAIAAVETDDNDKPTEDVTITSIEIIKDYSFE